MLSIWQKSIGRIYWCHLDQFLLNLRSGNMIQALLIPSAFLKKSHIFQFAKSIYCWYLVTFSQNLFPWNFFPTSFISVFWSNKIFPWQPISSQFTSPFIFSLPDYLALIKLDHLETSFLKYHICWRFYI